MTNKDTLKNKILSINSMIENLAYIIKFLNNIKESLNTAGTADKKIKLTKPDVKKSEQLTLF